MVGVETAGYKPASISSYPGPFRGPHLRGIGYSSQAQTEEAALNFSAVLSLSYVSKLKSRDCRATVIGTQTGSSAIKLARDLSDSDCTCIYLWASTRVALLELSPFSLSRLLKRLVWMRARLPPSTKNYSSPTCRTPALKQEPRSSYRRSLRTLPRTPYRDARCTQSPATHAAP